MCLRFYEDNYRKLGIGTYTPLCRHSCQILKSTIEVLSMIVNIELWQQPGSTHVPLVLLETYDALPTELSGHC